MVSWSVSSSGTVIIHQEPGKEEHKANFNGVKAHELLPYLDDICLIRHKRVVYDDVIRRSKELTDGHDIFLIC